MATPPPDKICIIGGGVFGLTLLHSLLQRYPNHDFTIIAPSIPETLAPAEPSSTHSAEAAAPRIASNDVNRIIRPDYADADYAELMGTTMPQWRETPGLSSFYHEPGLLLTADKDTTAEQYVGKSLANVKAQGRKVREFSSPEAVGGAMGSSVCRATGSSGYLNTQAGWADAGGAMGWLWEEVGSLAKERNVRFVRKSAEKLLYSEDGKKVLGARMEGGEEVRADLTVLAAGAWTGRFLDMNGIASARGQSVSV